jgi:hypothetical protein
MDLQHIHQKALIIFTVLISIALAILFGALQSGLI